MNRQHDLDSIIQERLDELKPVPARHPQAAARARARFMAQAVSAGEVQRHKGWTSIFRKEQFAMNMIISVLVIAGLLFGGGATVNAAQDDLPNQPLYGLKVWSEELSLRLQNEPEPQADRLMDLSRGRIQEMTALAEAGQAIPDQVRQRLEQHIHQALQLCSTMDDPALDRTLLRLRDHLQEQDRDLEQLQLHAGQNAGAVLEQTRSMLRQRIQIVEAGLLDHEMFRNAARNGFRYQQEDEITPPAQNKNGQPISVPGKETTEPGGPNTDPVGPNTEPIGPNPEPGGPNTDPGGTSPGPGDPGNGGASSGNGEQNPDSGGANTDPGNDLKDTNQNGGDGPGTQNQGGSGSGNKRP